MEVEEEANVNQKQEDAHGHARPRFALGKQSSLKPDRSPVACAGDEDAAAAEAAAAVDPRVRLMYLANEGDMEGIEELLDAGTNVNFHDVDGRTALHVAACQGRPEVVRLLLRRGAAVDRKDRWGSTPFADAVFYKNHTVIKLLQEHGAKPPLLVDGMATMHVENEIDPKELDFSNTVDITKGTFQIASWRGIEVAVKRFGEDLFNDEDKVNAFIDELAIRQQLRHPNIVQFLGAVTKSNPMMIVTEYLPKGDFRAYLKRKHALKPTVALQFALDIARGMNYLHEHKPEAIIHRDLQPSNLLRDDSGNLKVADFGVSKILKVDKTIKEDKPVTCEDDESWRYVAPEVYGNEEYGTKVDVFSFALILQEMIEGRLPFFSMPEKEVPKAYVASERPPFNPSHKCYAHGLRELIIDCWSQNPVSRPTFEQIIIRLENINAQFSRKKPWTIMKLFECFHGSALWNSCRSDSSTRSPGRSTR